MRFSLIGRKEEADCGRCGCMLTANQDSTWRCCSGVRRLQAERSDTTELQYNPDGGEIWVLKYPLIP